MRFRIGRTEFALSYPLVCIMSAIMIYDRTMTVPVCFLCALMHEAGHLIAMRAFGAVPERISLSLFDIAITDRKKAMRKRSHDLIITLAGVSVNFVFAAAGYVLYSKTALPFWETFTAAHLTLGVFNSMPVDSLDGGQALYLILSSRLSPAACEMAVTVISLIVLVPLACLGFLVVLRTRYNYTLLLAALYLTAVILFRRKAPHTKKPTPKAEREAASATTISGSLK